jgi:hypothetical protein
VTEGVTGTFYLGRQAEWKPLEAMSDMRRDDSLTGATGLWPG